MEERQRIEEDIARTKELSWRVTDIGYVHIDRRYSVDFWDAFDGEEPIIIRVFYRRSRDTGAFIFDEGVLTRARALRHEPIKTEENLWELAQSYKTEGVR